MTQYISGVFPDVSPELSNVLLKETKKLIIVGVIGKSSFPDCNKMAGLEILNVPPSLINEEAREGKITFYHKKSEPILFVHFETTYDHYCMQKILEKSVEDGTFDEFFLFNGMIRSRFARTLLFAIQVCHIVVFVETHASFDTALLPIFKSLNVIRERHVLKFLPKLVKNSNAGLVLGKDSRLCSPRFLFFFENYPEEYDQSSEAISKLEFEVEDNIYKMLRTEFVITNNSSASLFSIPGNKRFVYFNTNKSIREDPLLKSIDYLKDLMSKSNFKEDTFDDIDDLRPYKGFGKPLNFYTNQTWSTPLEKTKPRTFMNILMDHVTEALTSGFDDSISRYKGSSHFSNPPIKEWFDIFKLLHKLFIENPDNPSFEANDADYKSYLENFNKLLDVDEKFFTASCDAGLKKAIAYYNFPNTQHYGLELHESLLEKAMSIYKQYAKGPHVAVNAEKLRETCEQIWLNGKQQCSFQSLRGNPCVMPKHVVQDVSEHSSGVVFVSTCNCGRTQGRREDPYTIKQANYDFYQIMADNCSSCVKVEKIQIAVFEPSITDYRPAEVETTFTKPDVEEEIAEKLSADMCPVSQPSHTNLSLESMRDIHHSESSEESINELVIHVGEKDEEEEKEKTVARQSSTTEYLPGMVHAGSPAGLLPRFSSWSLVCVGNTSVYSHSNGLSEHFQSGFWPGTNFLLPWDVHVRLEHSRTWTAVYEKMRYRKKGEGFMLKIFVGCEYECPRGHRFIMSSPDKVLRGNTGIVRDSGSKVVFNNMPLYFPCPCASRNNQAMVGQLMRVHVVTPKAPVNVNLNPRVKIRSNERNFIFNMGLSKPAKLTQSAYWILRLPYIYQADDGPIAPPTEVHASTAMSHGCLMDDMYSVTETEEDPDLPQPHKLHY